MEKSEFGNLKKVEFMKNSECSQMNSFAFSNSSIECISIPLKVIDSKCGIFSNALNLIDVKILDMHNNLFKYENEFILTKSNSDFVFDVLLFELK